MKKYFLAFDFWNKYINKFYSGCVTVDLGEDDLTEVCKQIIRDNFPDIDALDCEVKVTALNNIEI